jgi:hypothetical protein
MNRKNTISLVNTNSSRSVKTVDALFEKMHDLATGRPSRFTGGIAKLFSFGRTYAGSSSKLGAGSRNAIRNSVDQAASVD